MAERIQIAGEFRGTVTFKCYSRLDNDNLTPYISVECQDEESGKIVSGKWFCSERALPYTVKKLKRLGCSGDTDREVIKQARGLQQTPCQFSTKQNGDYIELDGIKAYKEAGIGNMDESTFLNLVFGATPASMPPPAPPANDIDPADEPPF